MGNVEPVVVAFDGVCILADFGMDAGFLVTAGSYFNGFNFELAVFFHDSFSFACQEFRAAVEGEFFQPRVSGKPVRDTELVSRG